MNYFIPEDAFETQNPFISFEINDIPKGLDKWIPGETYEEYNSRPIKKKRKYYKEYQKQYNDINKFNCRICNIELSYSSRTKHLKSQYHKENSEKIILD